MSDATDIGALFEASPEALAAAERASLSDMALGIVPSPILVIAYDVQARMDAGATVANYTVGDFSPKEFHIPTSLRDGIVEMVRAGQTNYPPAHGVSELRTAIRDAYARELGLEYPMDSIAVCSGARPALYAAYRVLLSPGEKVVAPAPSWNNDNFCQVAGAELVHVPTRPEDGFMPTARGLAPYLGDARLLVLCSPMNPTGTMIREEQMRDIAHAVLAENARRAKCGERLLYVLYDQVYRLLTFDDRQHVTPVGVAPEMAKYTIFTDAISKCFAATGLRVGWGVAPPFIAARMKALMTHVGAWAPRPEQMATAQLLNSPDTMADYLGGFRAELRQRLGMLSDAFRAWRAEGLPVDVLDPAGAMYLSVRFDLIGRAGFPDDDAVRRYLLDEAGCAIIPFRIFGDTANPGWVRFSVGAVSREQIRESLPRLRDALVAARRD